MGGEYMSFSSMRINISTKHTEELSPIECNIDTYDIKPHVIEYYPDEVILHSMVLDRSTTYLSSLVFTEKSRFLGRDIILYISWHHSSDPDLFDVIVEVGRYLKEIGFDYAAL
jgi:hypothetical protein